MKEFTLTASAITVPETGAAAVAEILITLMEMANAIVPKIRMMSSWVGPLFQSNRLADTGASTPVLGDVHGLIERLKNG
jgi:hypothetical protein